VGFSNYDPAKTLLKASTTRLVQRVRMAYVASYNETLEIKAAVAGAKEMGFNKYDFLGLSVLPTHCRRGGLLLNLHHNDAHTVLDSSGRGIGPSQTST